MKLDMNDHEDPDSDDEDLDDKDEQAEWQKSVFNFVESTPFIIIMTIITIYALFGDDLRQPLVGKDGDKYFWFCTSVSMFAFTLEIILCCLSKPKYIWGFFFWLDFISTITLLMDIGWSKEWMEDLVFGSGDDGSSTDKQDAVKQGAQLTKASRASRIGTKAGRIVRVIRLIRLIRIVKIYKNMQNENEEDEALEDEYDAITGQKIIKQKKTKEQIEREQEQLRKQRTQAIQNLESKMQEEQDAGELEMPKETNVGKKLSQRITKRVIMLVMIIMISTPFLTSSMWVQDYSSYEMGLETMYSAQGAAYSQQTKALLLDLFIKTHEGLNNPMIKLTMPDYEKSFGSKDIDVLREEEQQQFITSDGGATCYIDISKDIDMGAWLSFVRTILVCFVLGGGAMLFQNSAEKLIVDPIEKMLEKIDKIAKNPLEAQSIEYQDQLAQEQLKKDLAKEKNASQKIREFKEAEKFETKILEKTIIKIGALLALGFGECGTDIIKSNMQQSGDVNPLMPGHKMMGIYGFCDIRNFTDATEILQTGVMRFTNEIGGIVHETVATYQGAANKNIGDAFFLVWKYEDKYAVQDPKADGGIKLKDVPMVHQLADMATISFLRLIYKIKQSAILTKYSRHADLRDRLGQNYRVRLGFGLHVGWSIEGAIGSEYKIDATCLSPHVNMCNKLEEETKAYGVPFLISGQLHDQCTRQLQKELRLIDVKHCKGQKEPTPLYCCDLDETLIPHLEESSVKQLNFEQEKRKRLRLKQKIKAYYQKVEQGKTNPADIMHLDEHLKKMRKPYTREFYLEYQKAMQYYLKGQWEKAKPMFEKTRDMLPGKIDGPSCQCLRVMEEHQFKAPDSWKGYQQE